MSDENPCRHDCSDFPETQTPDHGCCTPIPVRRDCERPVLPVPDCDEEDAVIEYDADTEEFTVISTLYDQNCSAILDQNDSPILTVMG